MLAFAIAVAWLAPVPVGGQSAGTRTSAEWTPPRTPWGDVDLQGIWDTRTPIPFERPAEFGLREFMTEQEAAERERLGLNRIPGGDDDDIAVDLARADEERYARADQPDDGRPGYRIAGAEYNAFWSADPTQPLASLRTSQVVDPPDGRLPPLTREALTRWQARHEARRGRSQGDSWVDRNVMERCLMRPGLPMGEMVGNNQFAVLDIVQGPGYVAIVTPYAQPRIIPLDGRPQLGPAIRQWYGVSRGRWEGDTLVVETGNFNDKQDGGPILTVRRPWAFYPGSGETLRMTERLTRVSPETLEYRYTVDDPKVFVRPWTAVVSWGLDSWSAGGNQDRVFEYACHEHNYGMVNALKGSRADRKWALGEAAREDKLREQQLRGKWDALKSWEEANSSKR
jgi:hypothetical protein